MRALVLLIAVAGCHAQPPAAPRAVAGETRSNILRADYAGSASCEKCHADVYRQWQHSPMHNMTRLADGARVQAPFEGRFRFKADAVEFSRDGGDLLMRIVSPRFGDHLFKVTRVIGGHHREDFAGVEVGVRGPERVLPASWLIGPRAWRYKGYSVMVPERPGLRPGGEWARTCIFCHNTVPYFDDLFGALAGPGTPPYQGEVVDPLLPPEKRWSYQVTDEAALARAAEEELAWLGARVALDGKPARDVMREAVQKTRNHFGADHLVETGIGCESCHGGAREHVANPSVKPAYEPRASFLRVAAPSPPTAAERVNRLCARCHQVLFSRYPYTWEGGRRGDPVPGGANINSGEARDFLLGYCGRELACVACHDPHAPDNREKMAALDGKAGDEVCLRCHGRFRGDAAIAAHTHHAPAGEGARCMNCHMPRKNLSLEVRMGRYHRIGSPSERARVEGDRPLECALCHADRTVGQLLDDLARFWGARYDRDAVGRLYGGLDALPLYATLERGKPHEVAAAAMALGDARARDAIPLLVRQLGNPIPLVRAYVLAALEKIAGSPSGIDLHQEVPAIDAAARRWLGLPGQPPVAAPPSEDASSED